MNLIVDGGFSSTELNISCPLNFNVPIDQIID